jgi:hypothetical protein
MTVSAEVPGFMADEYLVDRLWLAPKERLEQKGDRVSHALGSI